MEALTQTTKTKEGITLYVKFEAKRSLLAG